MYNSNNLSLRSSRVMTLGSSCKLVFIKKDNKIIPTLMLIGVEAAGEDANRVWSSDANGLVGIITSEIVTENNITEIQTGFKCEPLQISPKTESSEDNTSNGDWLDIDPQNDKIVYPRIFINSLNLKTDSNSLVLKYQNGNITNKQTQLYQKLQPYEDFSILTRSLNDQYILTLNNGLVMKKGAEGTANNQIQKRKIIMNYFLSNADTSIYLDAIDIAKENSQPKVSYEIKPNNFNSQIYQTIYNRLGNIVRINDTDLKFDNVRGYISSLTLDLDNAQEDTIEVKNYKTKFEDLFSTITAQTEAMKKNNHFIEMASSAFTSQGGLSQQTLQSSIIKVDLNYAFNNGKLTIDENNGIWGTSDTGVVAFRGGGIFTATEQDASGNWRWNSGITPEGINASLITAGQLDTNLIKIYAGDRLRFQMNGDGIFAYKSILTDDIISDTETAAENSIDGKQYVLYNEQGLSLIAKRYAQVLNENKNGYYTVLNDQQVSNDPKLVGLNEIKRVEISWDGLILRNWHNQKVFFADPFTGNLTLSGYIDATSGHIGNWHFNQDMIWSSADVKNGKYTTFVALNCGGSDTYTITNDRGEPITTTDKTTYNTGAYAFWAGDHDPEEAPLSITKSGVISAIDGKIGGWSITQDGLRTTTKDNSSNIFFSSSLISKKLPSNGVNNEGNENISDKFVRCVFYIGTMNQGKENVAMAIRADGAVQVTDLFLDGNASLPKATTVNIVSLSSVLRQHGTSISNMRTSITSLAGRVKTLEDKSGKS